MFHDYTLFGSITKIEEQEDGTIKVYGVASSGNRDTAGEVVAPDAMKAALPDYSKFPALREMHQPIAAGKVTEADVDGTGVTNIVAHVVDPVAVNKVKLGVYKGFSIGGKVTTRDPADRSIITGLRLIEISLVDSPCNTDAVLTMWKADIDMATEFKPASGDVIARAKQLAKAAGTQRFKDFLFEASQELTAEYLLEKGELGEPVTEPAAVAEAPDKEAAAAATAAPPADPGLSGQAMADFIATQGASAVVVEQPKEAAAAVETPVIETPVAEGEPVADVTQGDESAKEAAAPVDPVVALEAALEEGLDKAKAKDEPYGDVEYADPGYQKDGKKRYPLDTEEHIRAAWNYIHKDSNREKYSDDQVSKIEAKIEAAWKSKIDKDGPPSAAKAALVANLDKAAAAFTSIGADLSKVSDDAAANMATADALGITKSLYLVSSFACALQTLAYIQSSIECEEQYEGDDTSMAPSKLAESIRELGSQLVSYAQEEVAELVASLGDADNVEIVYVGDDCAYAASVVDLTKADEAIMAKAGSRHSKADKSLLQGAHDNLVKMGAVCDNDDAEMAAAAEEITTVKADNERLSKALTDAVPKVEELTASLDATKAEVAELKKRFDDEPLPPKTAGPAALKPVAKGVDSAGGGGADAANLADQMTDEQVQKALDNLTEAERGDILLRCALRNPQPLIQR